MLGWIRAGVRVILRRGAGDVTDPDPCFVLDPGSRIIHRIGSPCHIHKGYFYDGVEVALRVGGNPCPICLSDWETLLERRPK